ncbi:MAG: efflux RND transporter periplasmic adaptor subunit [Patescibacteria group bacterium]
MIVLLLVGGAGGFLWYRNQKPEPQFVTAPVVRKDIIQTVEATGSVASTDDLKLSFKTSGKIGVITVKVGDTVSSGQVLATINDPVLNSEVKRTRAKLSAAQADLEKLRAGATSEQISVKRQQVEKAKSDLVSAQIDIENARTSESTTRQIYIDTALQDLSNAAFVIRFAADTVYDAILDQGAQASFETTNTSSLLAAGVNYDIALNEVEAAQDLKNVAAASSKTNDILSALEKMRSALEGTSQLLDNGLTALVGAIVTTNYPQTTIDGFKTSFNTRATAVTSSKTSIQSSITNLTSGLQTLKAAVDAALSAQEKASQAVKIAEAELALTQATAEPYEIRQQEAVIAQAQADVASAESKFIDTSVIAPIAGVITAIDKEIGEVTSPNETVIKMIGDSVLIIDVDIPEADINKVSVQDPADITLDAFGVDKHFRGSITFIEPSERIIQDVVYYRVTIQFDESSTEVKPGMTADVTLDTDRRVHVLTIPFRAVALVPDGSKTVRLLINGSPIMTPIVTGLRGDDGDIEIVSGVVEGDLVITGERNGS